MRRSGSDESLSSKDRADDRFFVLTTGILPFLAQAAYIFDVFYYHTSDQVNTGYEGLLSSILSVFVYLQYCAPFRSRYVRFFYHLSLWILSEVGTLGHIISYSRKNDIFHVVLYAIWGVVDSIYFACLIYCRVFGKSRGLHIHIAMKQEHLFHFISRLEVILAIFIPVFFDTRLVTLTRDNIAFYILFDFFAESYHRFNGVRMKAVLYVFVITVTASVATEWIHITRREKPYEIASLVCEIIAACLCYALIVMQFFPSNFITKKARRNRRLRTVLSTNTQCTTSDYLSDRESTITGSENIARF
ncbi:unnamed protein product [Adineta ricciae]|uniref:Uncharacterized protein n=2 Tax=Adineta ricciae TaxID=249248 RepID=A0A813SUE7_ADIRI|nr:unnamed protein product [Adineta ricciae]